MNITETPKIFGGSLNSAKLVDAAGKITCNWSDGDNSWPKFGCRKSQSEP